MSTAPSDGQIDHGDDSTPSVPRAKDAPSPEQGAPKISDAGHHGQTTSPAADDDVGVPDDPGGDR